ncbi:MAG: Valine--tRNA ligase [Dehalococcoides mccartyi]|nr:Valine--tRNA ligase [Dehalococcoides mccartyi]
MRPYLPKALGETDIIIAPFPQADETCFDEQAESIMGSLVEVVRSLRNLRAEHNVEISRYIQANIYAGDMAEVLSNYLGAVETLSRSRPVNILPGHYSGASTATEVVLVLNGIEVVVPMSTMVDLEAEAKRVEAEIAELETQIERLSARLSDTQFLAKAPQAVVDKERTKLEGYIEKVSRLKAV